MTKQTFLKLVACTVLASGVWCGRSLNAAISAIPSTTLAADTKEAAGQVKTGTIGTVDAKKKTFELKRDPRPLTMTVNDKTVITLDGKASTFDAAIKPDLKVSVTYVKSGEDRVASKVEVTTEKK
ncbi:MAG: hypothetical protein ABSH20_23720 [Tepidisphaeraceae bacterium]|jgi:hypothetical protein